MGKNDKLWMILLLCLFSLILMVSPALADAYQPSLLQMVMPGGSGR